MIPKLNYSPYEAFEAFHGSVVHFVFSYIQRLRRSGRYLRFLPWNARSRILVLRHSSAGAHGESSPVPDFFRRTNQNAFSRTGNAQPSEPFALDSDPPFGRHFSASRTVVGCPSGGKPRVLSKNIFSGGSPATSQGLPPRLVPCPYSRAVRPG